MAGRIAVVDADNRFLRFTDRAEIHRCKLPHRSVHVLLFDAKGRLLIQRRQDSKLTDPGFWALSASGHVEEEDYLGGPDERLDEVYAGVARREVEEELGVEPELERVGAYPPLPGVHYEHIRLYRGESDGPFVLQADEVAEIRHVTRDELRARLLGPEPHTGTLRFFATAVLGLALAGCASPAARPDGAGAAPKRQQRFVHREAMVPMRDGVTLQTLILTPRGQHGPLPLRFLRDPYGMVQVQSSGFPLFDRNPQKFVPNIFAARAEDFTAATQRIHRSDAPSRIVLPVVTAGSH